MTSLGGNGTTQAPIQEADYAAADWINHVVILYSAPWLIVSGTFGNVMCIVVLRSAAFRQTPSSVQLSALAAVDIAVLNTGLLRHWLLAVGYHVTGRAWDMRTASRTACKVHTLMTYFLPQVSAWTLVLVTLERLVSVKLPLAARQVCSKSRMLIALIVIAAILFLLNAHALGTIDLYVYYCEDTAGNWTCLSCQYTAAAEHFLLDVWPWVDLLASCLLPGLVIAAANLGIIRAVRAATWRRVSHLQPQGQLADSRGGGGRPGLGAGPGRTPAGDPKCRSLSTMLLAVSVLFLCTTCPITIYLIGHPYWPRDTAAQLYRNSVAYTATSLLAYSNHALNFAVYCLSGARFREALLELLSGRQRRGARTSSRGTHVSMQPNTPN